MSDWARTYGRPVARRSAEGEEFSNSWVPGQMLHVFYDDDDVWHSRRLLWPVDSWYWSIETPDGDRYCEELDQRGPDGPSKLREVGSSGRLPPRMGPGMLYSFKDVAGDDELRVLYEQGEALARAEAERLGVTMPAVKEVLDVFLGVPLQQDWHLEHTLAFFARRGEAVGLKAAQAAGAPAALGDAAFME